MKLEKAIEILELELHSAVTLSTHKSKDAIELGIEALKQIKQIRTHDKSLRSLFTSSYFLPLLPGETTEQEVD